MSIAVVGTAVISVLLTTIPAEGQSSFPLPSPEFGPRVHVEREAREPISSQAWPAGDPLGPGVRVRLPVPHQLPDGTLVVEPNVELVDTPSWRDRTGEADAHWQDPAGQLPAGGALPPWTDLGTDGWNGEPLPTPYPAINADSANTLAEPWIGDGCQACQPVVAEPMFAQSVGRLRARFCDPCSPLALLLSPANCSGDLGIGRERLDFAPFEVEPSQPLNSFRFRTDVVHGFPTPNRAEYFWASPTKGAIYDEGTDYQDFRFLLEMGGGSFSASTEIPIRMLDPANIEDTAGMGDMNVATKMVLVDGKRWQMSHVFRTYINTGAFKKGLGTGHVSLEPGLLFRYRWRPTTFLHSEIKYFFPVGGDPIFSGEVLRWGFAYSHLLFENDALALIHTGEFMGYSFLDGYYTGGPWQDGVDAPPGVAVNGETAYQFFPGLRFVADSGCDFGLFEFGISGTFSMGRNSLYDGLLRFDFRWTY